MYWKDPDFWLKQSGTVYSLKAILHLTHMWGQGPLWRNLIPVVLDLHCKQKLITDGSLLCFGTVWTCSWVTKISLHLQPWRQRQYVPLNCCYPPTGPYSITTQNTDIFTVAKASNLKRKAIFYFKHKVTVCNFRTNIMQVLIYNLQN
jgi:hypothetical protein